MPTLPAGWEVRHSKTHNRDYYFNAVTGKTQWELPVAGETVGAYHILVKHAKSRRPSSWRQVTSRTSQISL